jgi:hypothetical protein
VRAQRWHIIVLIFAAVFDLKIGKKNVHGGFVNPRNPRKVLIMIVREILFNSRAI